MGKLFGTDGIRGLVNEYPMTAEMALKTGRAVSFIISQNNKDTKKSKIVIGKDTRISGDMIESALVSGICSMGVDALLVGILPTLVNTFMCNSGKLRSFGNQIRHIVMFLIFFQRSISQLVYFQM